MFCVWILSQVEGFWEVKKPLPKKQRISDVLWNRRKEIVLSDSTLLDEWQQRVIVWSADSLHENACWEPEHVFDVGLTFIHQCVVPLVTNSGVIIPLPVTAEECRLGFLFCESWPLTCHLHTQIWLHSPPPLGWEFPSLSGCFQEGICRALFLWFV